MTTLADSITEALSAAEAQVIDALKQSQEAVAGAFDSWNPPLPLRDALPKVAELVDQSLAFAQKLIANQRDFSARLFNELADLPEDHVTKA